MKWEKVHQVKERKIRQQPIKHVVVAENIHIIEERDIVPVVGLENLRNYVSQDGGIELDPLMVRNHFIALRKRLVFSYRQFF